MMTKYYSINSEIVPVAEAKLQVNDLSILRGYGVFDYFRVREGIPIFIEDHLDRFKNSASYLGLEVPLSKSELTAEINKLIQANQYEQSGIRLILTGGYSLDGYTPAESPNLLIMEHPFSAFDPKLFSEGVKLITELYTRDTPLTKTTNYLVPIRLIKKIKEAKAFDVLYYNGQQVSESSRSNIFIIDADGKIATPKSDALEGITRKKVIALAKQHFNLTERDISLDEVLNATECFITSTTKGTMPVTKIDKNIIGDGSPGKITQALARILEEYKLDYITARKKIKSV